MASEQELKDLGEIIQKDNDAIATTFKRLHEVRTAENASKAAVDGALEDAVGHYTLQANILPPGLGPKEKSERNRNHFKQVLEDYTTPGPEHRGLTSMKIISHDYGYLESRTGYYESGITEFFQGQKVVQKNNHMTIRKKQKDGTYLIDTLIFNEIKEK